MKCRDCGQEGFKNVGEVASHKAMECLARKQVEDDAPVQEPASLEAIQRMATELGIGFLIVKDSRYLVVPRRFLPDETKYLGTNSYMGIKMRGYLQDDGLVVQEKVEFIR